MKYIDYAIYDSKCISLRTGISDSTIQYTPAKWDSQLCPT